MLAFTALAFVFALRRKLRWSAVVLSVFVGTALFLLVSKSGGEGPPAAYAGVAAAGGLLLVTAVAWWTSASAPARPAGLLLFLAVASVVALMVRMPLAYVLPTVTIGLWVWFSSYRRGFPFLARGAERISWRQPLLQLALFASFGATVGAHLFLWEAAAENKTGPQVLARLRASDLYQVSDATFARALLADPYLWRDSISLTAGTTTDPEWVVKAGRHKGDRWSETELVVDRDTAWKEGTIKHDLVTRLEIPRGRRVLYVHESSMAHRAGVRRGDVIRAIDGIALDRPDAPLLPERGAARLELVSARGEVREVTVTVTQVEWEQSTVSAERVIDVAGRKVGYVELHDFRAVGRDFRGAAERLRTEDIQELVLDLRMNDSNRIRWSVLVASAIGGARLRGKPFLREVYNDRYRDLDYEQAFGPWSVNLSLPRVFIITSKDTCSASEALINGLAAHMEVVTVGSTTCGKPVGSSVVGYGEHIYSIITFRIMNARGDGDYYSGLRPTCPAEDDPTRELGDPEEASLKTTLHYIQHGRCPEPPLVSGLL